jgi:D-alanyl-D-alanine carboxypeptidase
MEKSENVIERRMGRLLAGGKVKGVTLNAYRQADGANFHFSAGNLSERQAYFGMGTTYLYVTAILMQLVEEGKLTLDMPFVACLANPKWAKDLHVKDGVDYTADITIRHLMRHETGFTNSRFITEDLKGLSPAMMEGEDDKFTFEDLIAHTRSDGAANAPGCGARAIFSEAHFHILGKVIEDIEQKTLAEVVETRIARPLGLHSTYVYCDPSDRRPLALQSTQGKIEIALLMTSFQAESGIVTTSQEAMIFARAFFEGYLFNPAHFKEIADLKPFVYPVRYGAGFGAFRLSYMASLAQRFKTPARWLKAAPELQGHMGKNGSFVFWCPLERIYVTGTLNYMGALALGVGVATQVVEALSLAQCNPVAGSHNPLTPDRDLLLQNQMPRAGDPARQRVALEAH